MATINLAPIRAVKRLSGGPVTPQYYPEAASQTFVKGEAVYLVSGKVTEFTDGVDNGSTRFLGFAAQDASGVTDTMIGVYVPDDDLVFEGNIYHGTVGSAITAVSDVATLLPMKILASQGSGMVAVDKEDTASKIDCCRIVAVQGFLRPGEAVGDTYGRVQFIIEAAGRLIGR
jgi:hypothetical protein